MVYYLILFHQLFWRRQSQAALVLLPRKPLGWGDLVGCHPWGHKESDMTEWLQFHFSLSWIGEGNGNPLQRSCLENPRDGGAWWAAIYGVTQSWTPLKRLGSSSSSSYLTLKALTHNFNYMCLMCSKADFWDLKKTRHKGILSLL